MTTRDKLEFVHAMARATSATVRQCEALLRYARTFKQVTEWAAIEPEKGAAYDRKRLRIANKIGRVCEEIRAGEAFSLRYHLESIKTNLTGRDYPQGRWQRSLQYANEALAGDFSDAALGKLCLPVFDGALITVRVPGGEGIVVPS
jgi:hypothetical protein